MTLQKQRIPIAGTALSPSEFMVTPPLKIISSKPSTLRQFVQAFINYRHLFSLLIWRDINVRYRQTAVGLIWVALQPALFALIFTLIFGHLAQLPSDGVPYLVFAFSGAVIWRFFSQGVDRSTSSILQEESLVTKVYFPRWILPLSHVGSAFLDFIVALFLLLILVVFERMNPGWHLLLLPVAVAMVFLLAAFIGASVALLCCKFRDFTFLVSFGLQILQFLSPVFYSVSLFGPRLGILAYLNPLTGPFELFRLSVTGSSHFSWPGFGLSLAMDLIVLLVAARVIYSLEDELVDVI